ncbi:two-component system sensor histidine kinase [Aliarcobacter faecis]|uniref:sensor histidine kinase n=1 Tax=Aliarcobacter faecis TaxID=1564138 RepID=UPI00047D0F1B|nr:HAMP domain-containing sensor histidine kinase [Aliarcobacter faecis]QKF72708.1 two-component system sensor histidine kinase [Aliarcobacter faecis]
MKLRYQLYLFLLFLSTILFLVLTLNYISYKNQYEKDLKNFVNSEIRLHKKAILSSIQTRDSGFEQEKELFFNISKDALDLLKKDKNLNLGALKSVLRSKYNLKGFDFELYLIDNSYKVYRTTYKKDLNFDLKNIKDAKNFLDKSSDGNIYFSKFIISDPLSLEYKLYSYAKISDGDYLQISFINNQISNTSMTSLVQNLKSASTVKVYNVFKNQNGFSYYNLLKGIETDTKEKFFKSLEIIDKDEIFKNSIIHSGINFIEIEELEDNILTITTPIFDKNMFTILGYENVVIELKIDLSQKIEFMNDIKKLFISSLIVIFFILLLIFTFIQNRFTKPIESILKSIKESKKVDEELLNYNNELSEIANKYNILYDKFSKELESNNNLLKENKKFIADTVHQIRTPLTNIMMNGEMIKKFQKDKSMDVFIEQIDASINMLSNSYEDLAYLITSNSIEYKPKNIDLTKALKDRIKFFTTISKVNFKIIKEKLEDDIFININDIELERLIDNNLSNAIKYAFKDKDIHIILRKEYDFAILEFISFGNEIKNKKKIFHKNYREDEAKRGLGLGLFMVSNICNKYDIKYEVSYKEGQNIFKYILKIENI